MYLTELNSETGLVKIGELGDGVLAIKEFRDLINDKKFGIECFTAVALTADYSSPIKYYSYEDRPKKAQEEVTGNRTYWEWNLQIIQAALKKYDDLQYDPTLEEKRIYYDQKITKLRDIQEYDGLDSEHEKRKRTTMAQLKKELRVINADIVEFEKRVEGKNMFSESPIVNGYKLSRLEQKLEKKNSFYHTVR
jgi:hypothetical protein